MSHFNPIRRQHRALVIALVVVANIGIAAFIDSLAGAPAAQGAQAAATQPVLVASVQR